MTRCQIKWRPSGGRGEFEFVPAESPLDRDIHLSVPALEVQIPAEVRGAHIDGKPRLRKHNSNDRSKLHLPQLVFAVAQLPEPARSDKGAPVEFPLENKQFVMDQMDFEIVRHEQSMVVLEPLSFSVLRSEYRMDLTKRFESIAQDWERVDRIHEDHPVLAAALREHRSRILEESNSKAIRDSADEVIQLKSALFGNTNAAAAVTLIDANSKTPVEEEEIVGQEGKLLTRLHVYKERDRGFVRQVREHYRLQGDGRLICQACGRVPVETYGPAGESCMEAHHKVPIEQLQPDSVTRLEDMAMLCASCHRVVHSEKPCLEVDKVKELIEENRPIPME